jgi:hypothetical protein
MARRVLAALAAVLLTLSAVPDGTSDAATPSAAVLQGTPTPTDPPVVTDNDFVPDRDLSECVSAVPQPDCGSEAKGGWRQALVFGVVVVGLAFLGWRITRTVRRNRRELETTGGR